MPIRPENVVIDNDPVKDCLQSAWQALLNGDLAERDRQCERAEKIMRADRQPLPIKLVRGADGVHRPEWMQKN